MREILPWPVGPLTPQDWFLRIRHPEIIAVFHQRKAIVRDGILQRMRAGNLRKTPQAMMNSQFGRGNCVSPHIAQPAIPAERFPADGIGRNLNRFLQPANRQLSQARPIDKDVDTHRLNFGTDFLSAVTCAQSQYGSREYRQTYSCALPQRRSFSTMSSKCSNARL